jgi:hypothetical protein
LSIFYCLYFWDSPNLEGQVPVFISPRNRVVQLYPHALGFCRASSSSYFATDGQSASSSLLSGPNVVGRSVIYSYNSLSLSSPSPAELMTTSYCHIWDHWVPILLPLTSCRAMMEVF